MAIDFDAPGRRRAEDPFADLGSCSGGNMRIARTVIIPAILALGVAASALSVSEMSATTAHAPAVHVQAAGANTFYRS